VSQTQGLFRFQPTKTFQCAPKKIRGLIVGLYQLASLCNFELQFFLELTLNPVTIGALLAAIVLNATKDQQSHSAWRVRGGHELSSNFNAHITSP
jgi:SP family sugar:H+ symporter-like MFS transporter